VLPTWHTARLCKRTNLLGSGLAWHRREQRLSALVAETSDRLKSNTVLLKDRNCAAKTSALETKERKAVTLRLDFGCVCSPPLAPTRVRHAALGVVLEDSEKLVMHRKRSDA
jgi:hypothetical protein